MKHIMFDVRFAVLMKEVAELFLPDQEELRVVLVRNLVDMKFV